ncbi:MAG: cobalamin-binding protein [Saprospirales bacterium]|nr:MAG: cobalamin-binding protein [Saprospirales bacterium]
MENLLPNDVFGLIRPNVDAHSLGVSTFGKLIQDCGYKVVIGDAGIARAVALIRDANNFSLLKSWIEKNRITRLGFSYRLDPDDARLNFGKVFHLLKESNAFEENGGSIRSLYFAGLPKACQMIHNEYDGRVTVFIGDETPEETLLKVGVPTSKIPNSVLQGSQYDNSRMDFARRVINTDSWRTIKPFDRSGYPEFGKKNDTVVKRIMHSRKKGLPPLMRVHVGPYNPNYVEARKQFQDWLGRLSKSGFLDIVSIGSSQLSQSHFGREWGYLPNGGGVPINSEKDLIDIWNASRPMLVRTYAGTRNIPDLAQIYERTINIAWHALSFWWFCEIDGRGPHSVKYNLEEHFKTLDYIATTEKPFEPNIPHHFAFRGADDYTYVLSGYLAAIAAKKRGVKNFIIQAMLNTPKFTWGIQDLAKARALLFLCKELEEDNFNVFLQPRAGLDYFSPDFDKARMQLAAVSALMDDIDPLNVFSPDIIHVVSYSEAVHLATPKIIDESIQITLAAIRDYRLARKLGKVEDMASNIEVKERTQDILEQVRFTVDFIDKNYHDPYSPQGLYDIFRDGLMPVPYLWERRDEFSNAVKWKTGFENGGVFVLDEDNNVIKPSQRIQLDRLNG